MISGAGERLALVERTCASVGMGRWGHLAPMLSRFPRFAEFIETEGDVATLMRLRRAESIGR